MLTLGRRADLGRVGGGSVPSLADLMSAQLSHLRNVGQIYYVDGTNGNDAATGKSWKNAFATITKAVSVAPANSTIFLMGTVTEDVTISTAGITIIGCGRGMRAGRWNGVAGGMCCTVSASYVTLENIYFNPRAYSSGGGSAIELDTDAQWCTIQDCRFQGYTGSYHGITAPTVGADNVRIINCDFMYFNTATNGAGIRCVNAGGFQYSGWVIEGCRFNSCTTGVKLSGKCCLVRNNHFARGGLLAAGSMNAAVCSMLLDLAGDDATNSGGNQVNGNYFGGDDYSTAVAKAGTTGDDWSGNFSADISETEVGDNGVTVAIPAA